MMVMVVVEEEHLGTNARVHTHTVGAFASSPLLLMIPVYLYGCRCVWFRECVTKKGMHDEEDNRTETRKNEAKKVSFDFVLPPEGRRVGRAAFLFVWPFFHHKIVV